MGRLWTFLTQRETDIGVITDSTFGRAFTQRLGVGRIKHMDVKFLWLQKAVRDGLMTIESVATPVNVSDLGTKKLSRQRRLFPDVSHGHGALQQGHHGV